MATVHINTSSVRVRFVLVGVVSVRVLFSVTPMSKHILIYPAHYRYDTILSDNNTCSSGTTFARSWKYFTTGGWIATVLAQVTVNTPHVWDSYE